jgi:cbb3-type cytochrome oxidase cytochrome c subunit
MAARLCLIALAGEVFLFDGLFLAGDTRLRPDPFRVGVRLGM